MKVLKHLSLVLIMSLMAIPAIAQDFGGVITIKETKRNNVVTQKIYVKGDMVRVETYLPNDENKLKGVRLINLKDEKVTALLPSRKLYLDVPVRKVNRPLNVEVTRTDESATIADKACKKTLVNETTRGINLEFWINKGNFTFYAPLMALISKNQNTARFFDKIAEKESGAMPLRIIESRDGNQVTKREVTSITTSVVDDAMFEVPADYSLQEK